LCCKELLRRGFLKSYVMAESKQAVDFGEYLRGFWDYDNSPYVKEKRRKRHGIHRRYVKGQAQGAEKYWIPFFPGKVLGDITWADVDDFISELESLPLSPKGKNKIITSGAIPLKWAFHRGMIGADVSSGHTKFSGGTVERQILTPELAAAVFRVPWNDERARLANMLAMVTGIRAGEIQGLRVQDLGKDCLYIRHSWNFQDGLKTTKNNECRTVEVPFPSIIKGLLDLAKRNPHGTGMDSYVFWAELSVGKPMEAEIFLRDLRAALMKAGMNKDTAKVYTFHGWRHYFTAYMRERVNEKLLQSQTGHRTLAMLDHYSDHRIAGDRERIQTAQREVFGALIPSGAIQIEEAVECL
jgi:integrase